jgi:hypothetical protein
LAKLIIFLRHKLVRPRQRGDTVCWEAGERMRIWFGSCLTFFSASTAFREKGCDVWPLKIEPNPKLTNASFCRSPPESQEFEDNLTLGTAAARRGAP